jgi:hypothetical protein
MRVEAQIQINGTKADIWKTITDIRNMADIIQELIKNEVLYEPENGLVGLKWREIRLFFGKPASIDKWITDAVENIFYTTRAEMDGFIFTTTMTITENNKGIVLTSTHETTATGFIAKIKSLPMVFFKGMLQKAILKDLNDIKTAVEQQ